MGGGSAGTPAARTASADESGCRCSRRHRGPSPRVGKGGFSDDRAPPPGAFTGDAATSEAGVADLAHGEAVKSDDTDAWPSRGLSAIPTENATETAIKANWRAEKPRGAGEAAFTDCGR